MLLKELICWNLYRMINSGREWDWMDNIIQSKKVSDCKDTVVYRGTTFLLKWILVLTILALLPIYWIILLIVMMCMEVLLKCMEWGMPKPKRLRLNKFTVEYGNHRVKQKK